jgi:hypothetical protein
MPEPSQFFTNEAPGPDATGDCGPSQAGRGGKALAYFVSPG